MARATPCILLFLVLQMVLMSSCLPRNPDVFKDKKPKGSDKSTPQFMVDTYNYYSKSKKKPVADIIRCFTGTGLKRNLGKVSEATREISHKFTFNLTGLHRNERVRLVDLRIFTTLLDNGTSLEIELFHYLRFGKQQFIGSRTLHGRYSDWVIFNLKPRFRKWLRQNQGDLSNYQLQVKLRSFSLNKLQIGGLESSEKKAPLLVVFSKEQKKTKTNQRGKQVSASPSAIFTEGRTKRGATPSQRRQRVCRRRPMYVDFSSIGWDDWVIAPRGYQAYKCAGKCTIPIRAKYDPSNHAVVQTLAHDTGSKTRAACCVPKKLGPISMLYREDNNVITFRYRYEGMVVESCACR